MKASIEPIIMNLQKGVVMKVIILIIAGLVWLSMVACDQTDAPAKTVSPASDSTNHSFVIKSRHPTDSSDHSYFAAIDISTKETTPIYSIHETNGRVYLPIMSSFPECNGKVIQGYLQTEGSDNHKIFITTKILRDTVVKTVGI
jgi:hypothetical protein